MRPARRSAARFLRDLARLYRPTGLVAPLGGRTAGAMPPVSAKCRDKCGFRCRHTSSGLNEWPHAAVRNVFPPGFAARNAMRQSNWQEAGAYASGKILKVRPDCSPPIAGSRHPPIRCLAAASGNHAVYNKPARLQLRANRRAGALRAARELAEMGGHRSI